MLRRAVAEAGLTAAFLYVLLLIVRCGMEWVLSILLDRSVSLDPIVSQLSLGFALFGGLAVGLKTLAEGSPKTRRSRRV